jgi:hypothetical protein
MGAPKAHEWLFRKQHSPGNAGILAGPHDQKSGRAQKTKIVADRGKIVDTHRDPEIVDTHYLIFENRGCPGKLL